MAAAVVVKVVKDAGEVLRSCADVEHACAGLSGFGLGSCLAIACPFLAVSYLDLSFCSFTAVPLVCTARQRNVLPDTNKSVREGA